MFEADPKLMSHPDLMVVFIRFRVGAVNPALYRANLDQIRPDYSPG